MPVRRMNNPNNAAGALVPQHSAWGQALAGATARLIAHPAPIGRQGLLGFGGTIGGVLTQSAIVQTIQNHPSYFGDAPQSEQPLVDAPDPWNRS